MNGTLSELEEKRGFIVQADVSKVKDARKLVDETLREFGRLDILVNNAGVEAPYKPLTDLSEEEWDQVVDINLKGVFLCSKFAILAMRINGGGVMTNVSSNWGIVAAPYAGVYCASKAGVILLTKAMETAADGITANCICPGDTNAGMELRDLERFSEERRAAIIPKLIPVEEVARAILYLVSDEARMTTATTLVIDNGASSGESSRLLNSQSRFKKKVGVLSHPN